MLYLVNKKKFEIFELLNEVCHKWFNWIHFELFLMDLMKFLKKYSIKYAKKDSRKDLSMLFMAGPIVINISTTMRKCLMSCSSILYTTTCKPATHNPASKVKTKFFLNNLDTQKIDVLSILEFSFRYEDFQQRWTCVFGAHIQVRLIEFFDIHIVQGRESFNIL